MAQFTIDLPDDQVQQLQQHMARAGGQGVTGTSWQALLAQAVQALLPIFLAMLGAGAAPAPAGQPQPAQTGRQKQP